MHKFSLLTTGTFANEQQQKRAQANGKGPKLKILQKKLETWSEWLMRGWWEAALQAMDGDNIHNFPILLRLAPI